MIEKKTIIDQIEVTRSGHVQVRFALLILEDGVELSSRWHRVSIEPGGDVDAVLGLVNSDIASRDTLKASAVETDKVGLLKSICQAAHTPEVVKAHQERLQREALEPQASGSESLPAPSARV